MVQFWRWLFLLLIPGWCFAAHTPENVARAPQPSTCVIGTFVPKTDGGWTKVALTIKNNCGQPVDVRNTTITFSNNVPINQPFWGSFGNVSYPDNNTRVTTQPTADGRHLATMYFHIPDAPWANSKLAANAMIVLTFGVPAGEFNPIPPTIVYLDGNTPPPQTGTVNLVSQTARPANVSQNYAVVNVVLNGQTIQAVQLPWLGTQQVPNLNPGTYSIQPTNVTASDGTVYTGAASPTSLAVTAGQTATSTIQYTGTAPQPGRINVQVGPLPSQISGYTGTPSVTLTRTSNGSTTTRSIPWNATTAIDQLVSGAAYALSTPVITFNNFNCTGSFNPATATSSSTTPPTSMLSYNCVGGITQVNVNLNVTGLTSATNSVNVTLTPNDSSSPVVRTINLTNGSGSATVQLNQNVIYNVSSTNVSNFTVAFQPQPLTATANATETITYSPVVIPPTGNGRTIGYIPGWKTPPTAAELSAAGYTHVLIAFGVFSTSQPGVITPAFDTVTRAYIDSLHNVGIKVILSLGGALTSIPNTTVDFHQVVSMASSPAAFQTTFIQSVRNLVTQYGFDGIDIDIEHGLGVGGTMTAPTGDVKVMADILNQIHAETPNFLITMAPQTANISATSGLDATWANYSTLIMQTHDALTWVGIQLYNTGCMFGIDHVCYDVNENSPNFSVAMATDVLATWPQTDSTGRPTGFQPYIGQLRADQVVLGYPSPNAQGASDGAPTTSIANIKRAIQCLQTGVASANSCGTYVPPRAYGLVGGVFNWEVTYDQANQFRFARDLKTCVTTGNCT